MSMFSGENGLLIESRPAIDEALVQELHTIPAVGINAYDTLKLPKIDRDAKFESFKASGFQDSPDLRPQTVDTELLEAGDAALLEFKEKLGEVDNPDIAQAYRWKVNEILANNRMLMAAHEGKMRRFDGYNRFIYGAPDAQVTGGVVDLYRQMALEARETGPAVVQEAAEETLAALEGFQGDRSVLVPDPEVFQAVRERYMQPGGIFDQATDGIEVPKDRKITREIGEPVLRHVMDNIGLNHYDIAEASGSTWSLNHADTKMMEPKTYNLEWERFLGLGIGHETLSHGLEFANGMRSGFQLSARGVDRYENGNEGRAVIPEQIVYEDFAAFTGLVRWHTILRRQLAVALGAGVSGQQPRTFAEVYRTVNAIDRLRGRIAKPEDPEAADVKAATTTWNLLSGDTQKGTDGQGGAHYRYKTYLEGNVRAWRAEEQHPGIIELGNRGKFDITNVRHIRLLQNLGVLPELA